MAKLICNGSEHIPGLAEQSGYKRNWLAFWNAQTGDVKKRKNKFILFHGDQDPKKEHDHPNQHGAKLKGAAGDEVDLAPPKPKTESGPTEQTTKLKAVSDKVFLRLRVLDDQFQEFKDAKWHLVIEGIHYPRKDDKPGGPDDWGQFESGGLINVEISGTLDVHTGRLSVQFLPPPEKKTDDQTGSVPKAPPTSSTPAKPPPPITAEFHLTIGRLDPIQESAPDNKCLAGVQQRLNNLGYNAGTVDGVENNATKAAIKRFQRKCQLTADGVSGPTVQDALHKYHDQPGVPPKPQDNTTSAPQKQASPAMAPKGTAKPGGDQDGATSTDAITIQGAELTHAHAIDVLSAILKAAGLQSATITSGRRSPVEQATIMYDNLVGKGPGQGLQAQRGLYGPAGNQVIDVYVVNKNMSKDKAVAAMKAKIESIGPEKVSRHCANKAIDVAPSSIKDPEAFKKAAQANTEKKAFRYPPADPAFHLEIWES